MTLRHGSLVPVMVEWRSPSVDLSAIHVATRNMSRLVRLFMDHCVASMRRLRRGSRRWSAPPSPVRRRHRPPPPGSGRCGRASVASPILRSGRSWLSDEPILFTYPCRAANEAAEIRKERIRPFSEVPSDEWHNLPVGTTPNFIRPLPHPFFVRTEINLGPSAC